MALPETTGRYDGTTRVALSSLTLLTDCFSMSKPEPWFRILSSATMAVSSFPLGKLPTIKLAL